MATTDTDNQDNDYPQTRQVAVVEPGAGASSPARVSAGEASFTEIADWAVRLTLGRLVAIASCGGDLEDFDRGARTARTLMAIARDADGLKNQYEKERLAHEDTAEEEHRVSDEALARKRREIAARVRRAAEQDYQSRDGGVAR